MRFNRVSLTVVKGVVVTEVNGVLLCSICRVPYRSLVLLFVRVLGRLEEDW